MPGSVTRARRHNATTDQLAATAETRPASTPWFDFVQQHTSDILPALVQSRNSDVLFAFGYRAGEWLEQRYDISNRVAAWFGDLAQLALLITAA